MKKKNVYYMFILTFNRVNIPFQSMVNALTVIFVIFAKFGEVRFFS